MPSIPVRVLCVCVSHLYKYSTINELFTFESAVMSSPPFPYYSPSLPSFPFLLYLPSLATHSCLMKLAPVSQPQELLPITLILLTRFMLSLLQCSTSLKLLQLVRSSRLTSLETKLIRLLKHCQTTQQGWRQSEYNNNNNNNNYYYYYHVSVCAISDCACNIMFNFLF